MMRQLAGSAWRLTAGEWRLVAGACLMAPIAAITVRAFAPLRALRLFTPRASRHTELPPARIATIVDAVLTLAHARCLTKALVLHGLLSRRGVASDLVLGVAVDDRRMRAHAWLERDGCILIGAGEQRYATVWRAGAGA
jgi:hypothetical protein